MDGLGDTRFSFKNVSEYDVYRAFARVRSRSMGADGISHDMLLFSIDHVIMVITGLFNMCLQNGEFPTIWKTSIVKPLPKSSKIKTFAELRPICLLPILAKMLEVLVCDMLNEFITENNILPVIQSGFRRGRSTATALSRVTTDIAKNMDASKASCRVE